MTGQGLDGFCGLQGVTVPGREDEVATVRALDERPCAWKWGETIVGMCHKAQLSIVSLQSPQHSLAALGPENQDDRT